MISTVSKSKDVKKIKVIRCEKCNIPNPYGSAHICCEYDVAEYNLMANKKIEEWFKKGLRNVSG